MSLKLYTRKTHPPILPVVVHGVNQLQRLLSGTSSSFRSSRRRTQRISSRCELSAHLSLSLRGQRNFPNSYTTNCHPFFPILDLQSDTFDSLSRNFPWTLNSCLFVACTSRSSSRLIEADALFAGRAQVGDNPPTGLLERLMDEAQGIAQASLFAITTQTADIQAMAILAAFSINAVLPAAHAMSMGSASFLSLVTSSAELITLHPQSRVSASRRSKYPLTHLKTDVTRGGTCPRNRHPNLAPSHRPSAQLRPREG